MDIKKLIIIIVIIMTFLLIPSFVSAEVCSDWSDCMDGNDSCVDTTGNNVPDSCYLETDCVSFSGQSCISSLTLTGICSDDSAGSSGKCTGTPSSGEYGGNLTGGTSPDFHSGNNENSTCGKTEDLQICSTNGGFDPIGDGVCATETCNTVSEIFLDCVNNDCAVDDISDDGSSVTVSCSSSEYGWSCDSDGGSVWEQNGLCANDANDTSNNICIDSTYSFVCNSTIMPGTLYNIADNSLSCAYGDKCDGTLTDGNYDDTWGTIDNNGDCIASDSPVNPIMGEIVFNASGYGNDDDIKATSIYTDGNGETGTVNFFWFVNNILIFEDSFAGILNNTPVTSNFTSGNYTGGDVVKVDVNTTDSSETDSATVTNSTTINANCRNYIVRNLSNSVNLMKVDCYGNTVIKGNVDLFQTITFNLGETIENIVDGIIKITGDVIVTSQINSSNVVVNSLNCNSGLAGIHTNGSLFCNTTINQNENAGNGTMNSSSWNFDSNYTILSHSGSVGMGTTEPKGKLHIKGTGLHNDITGSIPSLVTIENTNGNTFYSGIDFMGNQQKRIASIMMEQTGGGSSLHFGTSNNYAVGVNNDALTIEANGDVKYSEGDVIVTGSGNEYQDTGITSTGTGNNLCYSGTGIFGSCTSDSTFKKNIKNDKGESINISLEVELLKNKNIGENISEKIAEINIRSFQWNHAPNTTVKGLIAEEVKEIIPEVVRINPEDGYLNLDYDDLVPYIIEMIKEQQSTIESMDERMKELEKNKK